MLRLAGPRPARLCLEIHGNTCAARQRVSIRVGTEPWVEASVGVYERRRVAIDLPVFRDDAPLVPLVVISHDAAVPNDFDAAMNDDRLLGIGANDRAGLTVLALKARRSFQPWPHENQGDAQASIAGHNAKDFQLTMCGAK